MKHLILTLSLMLLVMLPSTYASGTNSIGDETHDFCIAPHSSVWKKGLPCVEAPQKLYGEFMDIIEASATLDEEGTYTFEMTVLGQVLPASPEFPSLPNKPIGKLVYQWTLRDASGTQLGRVIVRWVDGVTTAYVKRYVDNFNSPPMGYQVDSSGHSLSVEVSQSYLFDFLGSAPTRWSCQTIASPTWQGWQAEVSDKTQRTDLPT